VNDSKFKVRSPQSAIDAIGAGFLGSTLALRLAERGGA
jgi:hypothetical protein